MSALTTNLARRIAALSNMMSGAQSMIDYNDSEVDKAFYRGKVDAYRIAIDEFNQVLDALNREVVL